MGNYSRSLNPNKEESSCVSCDFKICTVQGPPLKTQVSTAVFLCLSHPCTCGRKTTCFLNLQVFKLWRMILTKLYLRNYSWAWFRWQISDFELMLIRWYLGREWGRARGREYILCFHHYAQKVDYDNQPPKQHPVIRTDIHTLVRSSTLNRPILPTGYCRNLTSRMGLQKLLWFPPCSLFDHSLCGSQLPWWRKSSNLMKRCLC